MICTKCLTEKDQSEFHRCSRIKSGIIQQCKLCRSDINKAWRRANLRNTWSHDCMVAIRNKRLEHSINRDYLRALWDSQSGKCAVTGHEFKYSVSGHVEALSPSINRIDADTGFESGNLRITVHSFGMLRMGLNDDQVLVLAESIVVGLKEPRLLDPDDTYSDYKNQWSTSCAARVRQRQPGCSVNYLDLIKLWNQQGGRCSTTGYKFSHVRRVGKSVFGPSPFSASLDRIDNSIGYEEGNMRIVVFAYNVFKQTMNDTEVLVLAEQIVTGLERMQFPVVLHGGQRVSA